mmetsp:Transcript_814/g.1288  ORF Transcript_814/g.1288 Transcript_814/m.1288 type:complete len:316 (+) Transcript_814:33-980(+)
MASTDENQGKINKQRPFRAVVVDDDGSKKLRKKRFRLSGMTKTSGFAQRSSMSSSIISDVSSTCTQTQRQEEEVDERIGRLVDSVQRLVEVTEEQIRTNYEVGARQQSQHCSAKQDALRSSVVINHDDDDDAYERTALRLDGIEVYTVVSALTVGSSIACLDTYGEINNTAASWFTCILNYLFMFANVVSIFTGLHSTLTFSLATMYGRTAIGLKRDVSFALFFAKTSSQRNRGYLSFIWSLRAFVIQCVIVLTSKIVPEENIHSSFVVLMLFSMCVVPIFNDTNSIMEEAKVIFVPKKKITNSPLRRMSKKPHR